MSESPPRSVLLAESGCAAPSEHDRVGVLRLAGVVDDELVEVVGLLRSLYGGLVGGPDVGGRLAQPVTR